MACPVPNHLLLLFSPTAISQCKQQEAQVNLLEKELKSQQQRGLQQRGRRTSQHNSSLTANTALNTHQQTATIASKTPMEKQVYISLEDEMGSCEQGKEAKEKENRRVQTKSLKADEFNSAPLSFLEDIENELEKQKDMHGAITGGHTNGKKNAPKVRPEMRTIAACKE